MQASEATALVLVLVGAGMARNWNKGPSSRFTHCLRLLGDGCWHGRTGQT